MKSKFWVSAGLALSLISGSFTTSNVSANSSQNATNLAQPFEVPVSFDEDNRVYRIDVGNKKGTIALKIEKGEGNLEWENWRLLQMTPSIFLVDDPKKHSVTEAFANLVSYFKDPIRGGKEISDFSNKDYYIGVAAHIDQVRNNGTYYLSGLMPRAEKEPYKIKAYFYENKEVVFKVLDTVAPDGTFPAIEQPVVMWGKTQLLKSQIGRITIEQPIVLWKRDNKKLLEERTLKPGEQYRVYRYDTMHGGQYGLGGGYYITNIPTHIKYETPSKSKLALLY